MHTSSYQSMVHLAENHLDSQHPLQILDLGSYDVNGSYRPIFDRPHWQYRGVDLSPGPNVDIVLSSPYRFPVSTHSIDLIISGQAFEHIEFFWRTWLEMVRVLKPGGKIFLIAPSRGPEHRYPVDCWRFYPDGFAALAKYGSLELIQVHTDWEPHTAPDSAPWGDTVGVFYKPAYSYLARLRERTQHAVRRWLACN